MIKAVLKFLSPPVFHNDEEKTRSAYYINAISLISAPALILVLVIRVFWGAAILSQFNIVALGIIPALLFIFFLGKRGYVQLAGYLQIALIWGAFTFSAFIGNGVRGIGVVSYFSIIALTSLILDNQSAIWVTAFSIISAFSLAYAESIGLIVPQNGPAFEVAIAIAGLLTFRSLFIFLSIGNLQQSLKRARTTSQQLEESNLSLQELRDSLEMNVKQRTEELVKVNAENERRAVQFQTVAHIAQKIASERNIDVLLPTITEVISQQFDYYHVAIFLNDDAQEYAILSAANSESGKRALESGYKLPIGQADIVSSVANTGVSKIFDDLGQSPLRPSSADFPETRSEFALPLKVGDSMVGVLDVHSKQARAFDQTDAEVLITLADQITIAIQNARLFSETQTALAESQLLYGTVVKQAWKINTQSSRQIGYRYAGVKSVPLDKLLVTPEVRLALESGDVATTHPSRRQTKNSLAIPLKLRDETIGVINVNLPIDSELGEDEIDIVRTAAQRIALALENSSLLEESQRRASREQIISEMSAKIGSGTEIEAILKTTIQELGAQISGAQIMIELGDESNQAI